MDLNIIIMKRITAFLLFALLIVANGNAQTNVKLDEVIKATSNFILTKNVFKNYNVESIGVPNEILDSNGNVMAYVVNLKPSGFLVLSALKEQDPIIAYSTEGDFSLKNKNNIVIDIISRNDKFLRKKMANNISKEEKEIYTKNTSSWNKLISNKQRISKKLGLVYGPLLTDVWGSVNCYDDNNNPVYTTNYFTPNRYSAGCVAISMAQVLHYFEWPKIGVGSHSYNDNKGSSQKTYSVNFGNTTYDYANMLDIYQGVASTDTEQRAVGKLAYHCAVSVDMDFENTGSTSNVTRQPAALDNYFRFSGHYETPGSYSAFWTRIRENLSNGFPVLLSIKDTDNGAGHAPVVDGYDENTGKYHINWGWYNDHGLNGWYAIESWSPGGSGYDTVNGAVLDVIPDPEITNVERTSTEREFTVKWAVSAKLPAGSTFSIEQSKDGGAFTVLASDIAINEYPVTVANPGNYKYRVRAKITGHYYLNSYSETKSVLVKDDITALDFDGNDSFLVNDNNDQLDIKYTYTIETWFNIDSRAAGTYPVIMDRRIVFSLFLIDDATAGADYALRFVARSSTGSDAIIASIRTDNSSAVLKYNTWHHLAVTRDYNNSINTTRIFIDGNLIDSSTDPDFQLHYTANKLNIGARYWGSYERYLDGKLDGISISKAAKYTSDFAPDILVNYTTGTNTVLAHNLDEGTGGTLHDAAGNFSNVNWNDSSNKPTWYFESYISESFLWDGFSDSNWENPDNWISNSTMSLPRTGDDVVIDLSDSQRTGNDITPILPTGIYTYNNFRIKTNNNFDLQTDSELKIEETLTNSGTFELNSTSNITVKGTLENTGTFTLKSDANNTGSLIVEGAINNIGTINIERYLNDPAKWQLVSAPTNNETVMIFKGHYLNEYLEAQGIFKGIRSTSEKLIGGKGYVAKLDWGSTNGTADKPNPIIFCKDEPNYSDINITLDITDDDINNSGAHVSNTYFDLPVGFQLVGNPYPSNLDWNAVYNYGNNSSNITSYLYFYADGINSSDPDHSTPVKEGWQVYKAGTASVDSLISLGQGFGVVTVDNLSSKTITIPTSARTHNTTANIFHKKQKTANDYLEISVISGNVIDKATIHFNENASSNYDSEFDAYKIKAFNNSPVISIIADDNQRLAVSEMPNTEDVKLDFNMRVSGDVTFICKAKDFSNVVLEDKLEGRFIDILNTPYSFYYTNEQTDANRFVLHINKESLGNIEIKNDLKIYSSGNIIFINSISELNKASLRVFDMSGKIVIDKKLENSLSNRIISNLKDGIYIVKISSNNRVTTSKIIIR